MPYYHITFENQVKHIIQYDSAFSQPSTLENLLELKHRDTHMHGPHNKFPNIAEASINLLTYLSHSSYHILLLNELKNQHENFQYRF